MLCQWKKTGFLRLKVPPFNAEPEAFFAKEALPRLLGIVWATCSRRMEGTVDEIHKRETELIRPPVANVSLAVLLFSVKEPDMNLNLLDKFLVHIEQAGLDALIVLTKQDLIDPAAEDRDIVAEVKAMYEQIGYEVISTSSRTGEGSELLRERLAGKISVFSGQSGVGKSSMLNALMPGLTLETSAISMRLGRGKHTTRHVELIPLDNGGFVADTPGFSQLDFLEIGVEELSTCFRSLPSLLTSVSSVGVRIHMNQAARCCRRRRRV